MKTLELKINQMAKDQQKFTEQQVIQGKHFSDFRVEQTKTSTAVEVLTSRFNSFMERFERFAIQNKGDHNVLDKNQKTTNGKVMANTRWRWALMGAWAVITIGFPSLATMYAMNLNNHIEDRVEEVVMTILEENEIIEFIYD